MDDDAIIYYSRWCQIHWNQIFFLGIGFHVEDCALGIFLGPITIYIGDAEYGASE